MGSLAVRARAALTDDSSPTSLASRARARRWATMLQWFPTLADMRVLDLGGRPSTWLNRAERPRHVVCVNVEPLDAPHSDWCEIVVGDACEPLDGVGDHPFDLVFSNSVIEHVGGHARRQAFADNVHRHAGHHWVQTPNRYFPLEPHWLVPGFQFMPTPLKAAVSRRWRVGHTRSVHEPWTEAVNDVLSVELLGRLELQYYFPASTVLRERFAGITKSLIAVR